MKIELAILSLPLVACAPPAPKAFSSSQPNGLPVGLLERLYGTPGYHYTVAESHDGFYSTTVDQTDGFGVFAELDDKGFFTPSDYVLGVNTTEDIQDIIPKFLQEDVSVRDMKCEANDYCKWHKENNGKSGGSPPSGEFKNLVFPFRFFNHTNRDLQLADLELDTFNDDHISVKDYFESQSFGKLTLHNHFADPVDITKDEKYCADNVSGTSKKLHECLKEVLDACPPATCKHNIADFDIITFVHSGYGAEHGDRDNKGNYYDDRIWSHAWEIDTSAGKMRYALTSAFFGIENQNIQRVGIPIHEIAQAMGAPTLYAGYPGFGLGLYDVMSSPYGFDGTQHHCSSMSAFTRVYLEWAEVEEIDTDGTYTIKSNKDSNKVYKISKGFDSGEYLYIENRVDDGYDTGMRGPGLAIYHVDETADDKASTPDDANYPASHYRVSLIQADGHFDLEHMEDDGDKDDLFSHFKVDGITAQGPLVKGVLSNHGLYPGYPNTKGYAGGAFKDTGLEIKDISAPGPEMTFTVSFGTSSS